MNILIFASRNREKNEKHSIGSLVDGKRQYFAWHDVPNRNDDYITNVEISEEEFAQIAAEYPHEIVADRKTAQQFRDKYVEGHPVLLEGWNRLL